MIWNSSLFCSSSPNSGPRKFLSPFVLVSASMRKRSTFCLCSSIVASGKWRATNSENFRRQSANRNHSPNAISRTVSDRMRDSSSNVLSCLFHMREACGNGEFFCRSIKTSMAMGGSWCCCCCCSCSFEFDAVDSSGGGAGGVEVEAAVCCSSPCILRISRFTYRCNTSCASVKEMLPFEAAFFLLPRLFAAFSNDPPPSWKNSSNAPPISSNSFSRRTTSRIFFSETSSNFAYKSKPLP
mmetsp:Transcript_27746/g.70015  ORF Transcript_27746/g.70015 Transcript_27746/m.70015 type:complete len:240 (+) Transcript_27746:684-1403(+)